MTLAPGPASFLEVDLAARAEVVGHSQTLAHSRADALALGVPDESCPTSRPLLLARLARRESDSDFSLGGDARYSHRSRTAGTGMGDASVEPQQPRRSLNDGADGTRILDGAPVRVAANGVVRDPRIGAKEMDAKLCGTRAATPAGCDDACKQGPRCNPGQAPAHVTEFM